MKKFAFLFALIALVLLTVVSVHAEGEFVTDGDTLTGYTGTEAELVIPDGVKAIGDEAFHNSKYIEKITIPDSVETIGYNSFCDCPNLKELHLGTGVRKFGDNAIWKDYALTTITVDENNPYITVIDNVVFSKDKKTLLLFPDGYSGDYAIPDGVTKIGDYSFFGCKKLTSLIIPESVVEIGSHGLWGLEGIKTFDLPSGITKIAEKTFCQCTGLESLVIPDGVKTIEFRAFWNCTSLTSITFPDSLISIDQDAFYSVPLIEIKIPAGVRTLGENSFYKCSSLQKIIFEGDAPSAVKRSFRSCPNAVLYVNKDAAGFADEPYSGFTVQKYDSCSVGHYFKTFTEIVNKDPKCTDYKTVSAKCERCSEILVKATDEMYGHDTVVIPAKEPTCTEEGWEAYEACTRCDYEAGHAMIAPLGHDVVSHEGKAPTCTEDGCKAYDTCTRCGYTTYEPIPALGHDLIRHEGQAATYDEDGWKEYDTCSRCDYTTYRVLPKLSHDLVFHEGKAPTCTEAGYDDYYTCSDCDLTTYAELPALGHDWSDEWTTDVEATYDHAGSKSHHCVRCGEKTDVTEIPKLEITVDSSKMFKDVKVTSWFKGAVDFAVEKGLMNGVTEDTFDPNGSMTRAMLVTVLWRLEGEPASSVKVPFTDLKQAWYKDAVAWAYENEIVNGTSADKFSPNGAITREQMAAILFRFSEYKGYDVSSSGVIKNFPDAGKVHSYAEEALSWAVGEGLIGGVAKDGKTYLDPRGSATRAQVATILMRFCEKH